PRALVDRPALLVRDEGRALRATRQAPLLEPEQEHDLGSPRPGPEQVCDRDSARLITPGQAELRPLERAEDLLAAQRASEIEPILKLVQELGNGLLCPQIEERFLAHGRG